VNEPLYNLTISERNFIRNAGLVGSLLWSCGRSQGVEGESVTPKADKGTEGVGNYICLQTSFMEGPEDEFEESVELMGT